LFFDEGDTGVEDTVGSADVVQKMEKRESSADYSLTDGTFWYNTWAVSITGG
jgi:hypothetical protein